MQKTLLINGTLNITNAQAFLSTLLSTDTSWIPIFTNAIQFCTAQAVPPNISATISGVAGISNVINLSNNQTCDPFAAFVMKCMRHQLITNCPNFNTKGKSICEFGKVFYKSCVV